MRSKATLGLDGTKLYSAISAVGTQGKYDQEFEKTETSKLQFFSFRLQNNH